MVMMAALGAPGTELLMEGKWGAGSGAPCSPTAGSPPSQLSEEEACTYPGLASLLHALSKSLDLNGLSASLARQLEQVRKELHLQRVAWLRWEALHRLLREALVEGGATSSTPQDRKFLETLEQRLLLGELNCVLELGPSTAGDQPPLLGLGTPDLLQLQPPSQDLVALEQHLSQEIEERLRHKGLALLSYYWPESGGAGEAARCAMLRTLPERLAAEQRCLQVAWSRHRELTGLLERQRAAYPQVLLRCLDLLRCLAKEHRLGAQAQLDRLNTHYLEAKCSAMFLKIRLEELSILADTYSPETVQAHQAIRAGLLGAVQQQEQKLAAAQEILTTYESLGPEFEGLVREYGRLRGQVENKCWALQELSQGCN